MVYINGIKIASNPFATTSSTCRAVGATICNRTDELKESDIGTGCGLFEVRKIGDEYFTYLVECKSPKACTIVLRGASKDILKEVCSMLL